MDGVFHSYILARCRPREICRARIHLAPSMGNTCKEGGGGLWDWAHVALNVSLSTINKNNLYTYNTVLMFGVVCPMAFIWHPRPGPRSAPLASRRRAPPPRGRCPGADAFPSLPVTGRAPRRARPRPPAGLNVPLYLLSFMWRHTETWRQRTVVQLSGYPVPIKTVTPPASKPYSYSSRISRGCEMRRN